MDLEQALSYIVANKEIFLVIMVAGGGFSLLLKGVKRFASMLISLVMLIATLNYFGVPMEQIEQGLETGVTHAQGVFDWAQTNLPGYFEKIDGLLNKTEQPSSQKADVTPVSDAVSGDVVATVHFVDVGQADCILVQDGDDVLLIDVGNRDDAEVVTEYLRGLGIGQIDYFVATHPHEDHIGCAATVLRTFDVETVIKSEADNTTACYTSMMEEIEKQNTPVEMAEPGAEYTLGEGTFQILGPISESDDLNNASVVIRYAVGDVSFLFTGDAEREEELEILEAGYNVQADVLKVGHHGSSTSTSYLWLREIMPKYGVIMCATDNEYGHPHEETISRLQDADVEYFNTSINGTIVMETDGTGISVSTEY